jgi:hypothetical protein
MINSFKATIVLVGILTSAGVSRAADCDNHSLRGQYAFTTVGTIVGVFDSAGVIHPLASPLLVTAVGQYTFDGHGSFTRVDYNVVNGTPSINSKTPLTEDGFRTGQTGTYSVAPDCTGNMVLNIPDGEEINLAIVLVNFGKGLHAVGKQFHVPGFSAPPPGTSCDSGCELGVNNLSELTQNSSR